jgi:hypothetical protein
LPTLSNRFIRSRRAIAAVRVFQVISSGGDRHLRWLDIRAPFGNAAPF